MNEYVEIFIVSLKKYSKYSFARAHELEKAIKNKLDFCNKNIHYVGVNGFFLKGKKITEKYIEKNFFSRNFMYLGSLGCTLSHICILQLIQKKKILKDVLVLEEDAIINGETKDFCFALSKLPIDYDLASLYNYSEQNFYNQCQENDLSFRLNYVDDKIREDNKSYFFKKIIRENTFPGGTQCYLINGKKIDKIIEHILPIGSPLDFHYWSSYHKYNLNKYIINPSVKLCLPPRKGSIRCVLDEFGSQLKTKE